MKTLLIALTLSVNLFCQHKMTEKEAINKDHIDFTKEYLWFKIHGLIEIDGHTFKNDTCHCPIIFQANLDGVTIIDTCFKQEYTHRNCGVKNCKIIHLVKKAEPIYQPSNRYPFWLNGVNTNPCSSPKLIYDSNHSRIDVEMESEIDTFNHNSFTKYQLK